MISLLMPTRGRPDFVKRSVSSIIDNSYSINNFEIIFGLDNDDISTVLEIYNYLNEKKVNFKIILFDRLFYKGFHLYLNELFKYCSGDLLWTYPDDVDIITKNWDLVLENNKQEMYLMVNLGPEYSSWPFSIIPIISRKWIELTNRFSENSQTDLWLGEIAKELNVIKKIEDVSCNVFNRANGGQHNVKEYLSEKIQNEKRKDIEKLKLLLKI